MTPLPGTTATLCDWLSCTVPLEVQPFVLDDLALLLGDSGFVRQDGRFVCPHGGTVKTTQFGSVFYVGTSGKALLSLRNANAFNQYLMLFGLNPHKVTRLDAACDFVVDAPPVLGAIYREFRSGVFLTQKRAPVTSLFSPDQFGRDTGTVYLGKRDGGLFVRVYDKRHQVIDCGLPDPGPWLRVELAARVDGMTLRDASDPTSLFYQYIPDSLVSRPDGVVPWVPHAGGFEITRREIDPMDKMRSIVRNMEDLTPLAALASSLPGEGLDVALAMLRSELRRRIVHRETRREASQASVTPNVG